jgi:processive 1,2-diacylglycerol beta-glucosyltransferase/1,2-diacylglycerol 3-beta-galactosyltransferase
MAVAGWINRYAAQEAKAVVANGVSSANFIVQAILEQGYRLVTTRMPSVWKSVYDFSQPRLSLFLNSISIIFNSTFYLWNLIRREKPDMVVNCHFLVNSTLKILRRVFGMKFKVLTLCTDPFTIHPFWFYKQTGTVLLFSQIARNEIMVYYRIPPERVPVFPWVLQERYSAPLPADAIPGLKASFGLDPAKKLVLITGGGEGLPGTERYFQALLSSKADFELVVLCGKNRSILKHCREILRKRPTGRTVHVLGFTPKMYEYLNCADLVVSKAGTSTVMETLTMGKPLLIAQYLYGQEFGNAVFVVRKGLGVYAPRPAQLRAAVERLLSDQQAYNRIIERIRAAGIRNGTPEVARYILDRA